LLTDKGVKAAKPAGSIRKLSDTGGLQLWVQPNGSKYWRLDYRYDGKRKTLALGVYPRMSLREARDAREKARQLLSTGRDPSQIRKQAKIARAVASSNTFSSIAQALLKKKQEEKLAEATLVKFEWLTGLASSQFGARPITEITHAEILAALRKVETRGKHETASRLRAVISEVFRYGIVTGVADSDPARDLKGALVAPSVRHHAALIEPAAFGGLLRAIAAYDGMLETRLALDLIALTFVRPGELRGAEWAEFNLTNAVWSIPAERMKMSRPHKVPLAPQATTILKSLRAMTGGGKFLFPSVRSRARCMSENTLNAALRRMDFTKDQMTAHGFRAVASSNLNESGLWNPDAIEAQLAHADKDSVRSAYARAEYWDERVRMMAWWADKIDELRSGSSQRGDAVGIPASGGEETNAP